MDKGGKGGKGYPRPMRGRKFLKQKLLRILQQDHPTKSLKRILSTKISPVRGLTVDFR